MFPYYIATKGRQIPLLRCCCEHYWGLFKCEFLFVVFLLVFQYCYKHEICVHQEKSSGKREIKRERKKQREHFSFHVMCIVWCNTQHDHHYHQLHHHEPLQLTTCPFLFHQQQQHQHHYQHIPLRLPVVPSAKRTKKKEMPEFGLNLFFTRCS